MLPRIFIVAPCYFDLASFNELVKRAKLCLGKSTPQYEVHFVLIDDSGGEDPEVRSGLSRDLLLLTVPFNLGHQGALAFGLRRLAAALRDDDFIITTDSDGEDRPEDIPQLLAPLLAAPSNLFLISLAQRTKRSEGVLFKILYACFKTVFSLVTGTVVRNGNFAAFRGWFVKNSLFHPYFDYCYSSSLLALARQIRHVPIARGSRYYGKSKMTFIGLISHGLRMLLPFSERIAVRSIVASGLLVGGLLVIAPFIIAATLSKSPLALELCICWSVFFAAACSVIAVSCIFFHTYNSARAMSLRHTTMSRIGRHDESGLVIEDRQPILF